MRPAYKITSGLKAGRPAGRASHSAATAALSTTRRWNMVALSDILGQTFSRLTVIQRAPTPKGETRAYWLCRCSCGETLVTSGGNLRSGNTRSCGCLQREIAGAIGKITVPRASRLSHGHTRHKRRTPEYETWVSAKKRCTNPNSQDFPDYGGRGIKMCDRWLNSFEAFFADMGPRPSSLHSIDRIDGDGDYEPTNCRWATPDVQASNRRSVSRVTFQGQTHTITEWAQILGMGYGSLKSRFDRGWSVERALSEPMEGKHADRSNS